MSGRSGAISHTTLHEATKGNRLPSWGTTAEFVKACGADPAAYRERWEEANRAVRAAGTAGNAVAVPSSDGLATSAAGPGGRSAAHLGGGAHAPAEASASVPAPPLPPGGFAGDVRTSPSAPEDRRRPRLGRPAVIALVAAAGVGTVVLVVVAVNGGLGSGDGGRKPSAAVTEAALSPADCPVHPSNPAAAPPAHPGDAAAFIADITLPDCTRVGAGKTVTKVWRLKNSGKVPWQGYSLRRLDLPQRADQCQTISDVPIDDTRPGRMVDIRTVITTPKKPGLCYVRFKMVDASGRVAFPGNRPVNFQIIVEAP
ncbi:NBR1-Ig-like domain-containing protein [Actinomadura fibrosa]|uniref:NBR1-Ig-like domain-containing protein n=1 Tax=Actinomadura fibrosa TaxID=111802 RepID=A0ABW2XDG0_9ACTN|nr:NBR1-Ig-like domain-containing protein [Actinomadura fibrosa]